jgi:uncharacterized protein
MVWGKMMKRYCEIDLKSWKTALHRKPLLIRGARQVGKTFCIRQFGADHFLNVLEINFEQQKEYRACFDTLYPDEILKRLYTLSHKQVTPDKTLLFLDEIQECPQAILSLRYFYEQMPNLHVIAAGSLLEFTLRKEDFRMPVGRIQSLYMYPLSFKEFLISCGEELLAEYLAHATAQIGIEAVFHDRLIFLLREYLTLGGMPEVIAAYAERVHLSTCQMIQATILDNYRGDFGKYATKTSVRYLQRLYEKSIGMVGQHFKYVAVDPDAPSRDIKPALEDLLDAGLIYKVQATSAAGLPLSSTANEKKFKLLFVDVGLVSQHSGLSADILMQKDLVLINRGNIAEQFVGQELLAYAQNYQKASLYYWEREQHSSIAEVDYVTHFNSTLIPIEVKAGSTGSLRSLQLFLNEKQLKVGVQISQKPLAFNNRVLSIPLYMIAELPRLLSHYIQ